MDNMTDRIRVKRAELRLTQTQLGNAVGVAQTIVSRWENGLGEPRNGQLIRLAETLGVTTDWLLTGRDTARPSLSG